MLSRGTLPKAGRGDPVVLSTWHVCLTQWPLRVALAAKAELNILHVVRPGGEPGWAEFPGIRRTLQRWGGALAETTCREAALETGLRVGKILGADANPVRSVLDYLALHPTELIVLATHQRTGIGRLFHQATAGPIARGSGG